MPAAENSAQQEIPKRTLELISPVTLSYGNFNMFFWILEDSNMCSINRPEFPSGREEVFVVWVLVMGFPDALRRRRRSWQGLWYRSSGDSKGSSQRMSRRIWEASHWMQDFWEQPHSERTSKLRFPWLYWVWDIHLREGGNGVKGRRAWKKGNFYYEYKDTLSQWLRFSEWNESRSVTQSWAVQRSGEQFCNSETTIKNLMDRMMQEFFSLLLSSVVWNCL